MPRTHLLKLVCLTLAAAFLASAHVNAAASEFPDSYFYSSRSAAMKAMEGKTMPSLSVKNWQRDKVTPDQMKGKVVVIDFWATWCGPCMASIPKNVSMVEKHAGKGLVFIGVHDAGRGTDKIASTIASKRINYPVCVDAGATKAFKVSFWPTYVVVDRKGVVRAAGLIPDAVETVVAKLLKEAAPAAEKPAPKKPGGTSKNQDDAEAGEPAPIPTEWLEGDSEKRKRFDALLAAPAAPSITSSIWMNSSPLNLQEMRGKVVLVDFWATWCKPCVDSFPKMIKTANRYKSHGLVVIGVCHPNGAENMKVTAEKHKVKYPLCVDEGGKITNAYQVTQFPSYFLIDRAGKLRIADVRPESLDAAIQLLLNEKPPK